MIMGSVLRLLLISRMMTHTEAVDRIMSAICEPLSFDGFTLNITSSVGIAAFPTDGDQPSMLIERADAAMYRAKEAGRNLCQFYNTEIHARVQERALIESTLPPALAAHQLVLHYQPQISLADGKLVGAARPETFIPTHRGHRPLHGLAPWLCPGAVQFESMEGSFQSSQQVSSRAPVVTSVQAARSIPSGMPNQAIAA